MSEEGEEVPLSQPDLTPIKLTASTYIKYKDMDKEEFSVLYNGIKKKRRTESQIYTATTSPVISEGTRHQSKKRT